MRGGWFWLNGCGAAVGWYGGRCGCGTARSDDADVTVRKTRIHPIMQSKSSHMYARYLQHIRGFLADPLAPLTHEASNNSKLIKPLRNRSTAQR